MVFAGCEQVRRALAHPELPHTLTLFDQIFRVAEALKGNLGQTMIGKGLQHASESISWILACSFFCPSLAFSQMDSAGTGTCTAKTPKTLPRGHGWM